MTKLRARIKKALTLTAEVGLFGVLALAGSAAVRAQVPTDLQNGVNTAMPTGAPDNLTTIFQRVINTTIFLIGAIAVLMLIIGGIRYVTAAGSPDRVKGAQNTILYAIIGVIIAIIAFAAVNFIISRLSG